MKLLHLIIIVILTSGLVIYNNAYADNETTAYGGLVRSHQNMTSILPSPPPEMYLYTSKIFSVFQIEPEIVHPNDTSTIHILVTNNANFPLYDVNLGESLNDSKSIMFSNIHKIDILNPNQTKTISGVMHVSVDVQPTDYYDIWWNVIAKNETGNMMESMQFHRNLPIIQHVPQTCCDQYVPIPFDSPLKQLKSGVNVWLITCKQGFYFVLKAYDREPMCLKSETISKLASRGFLFATSTSNDNHTTVIISPGSENQASPHTYSPDVVTVVLGVNNTIRWVNQADVANTIVPDMPLIQNGKSFGSDGIIKPDQSYTFTFTEPGTFSYHTEPHPWMKGTVIVLPRSNQITSAKTNDPFGITALIIYHPPDLCLNPPSHSIPSGLPSCPPNKFYLKINSNSTAYLMGYNICDGNSCATNNNLSLTLPLNTGLNPDYQMIGLPVNLPWKYGDTVGIQLYVSPDDDNKTASLVDLRNSVIVP